MNDKLLVIISSGEPEKARTGAMYAVNALKHGWMEEVELYLFGPAQKLLLEDEPLQQFFNEFRQLEGEPVACRFLADRDDISDRTGELGLDIQYVGKPISDLIQQGYVPMVW